MTNAEFFNGKNGRRTLEHAFLKWCSLKGFIPKAQSYQLVLSFAASKAMEVLQFDQGQIVQFDFVGLKDLYGTVGRPNPWSLDIREGDSEYEYNSTIEVMASNGQLYSISNCGKELRTPQFPQGLVELVRNQLQANCPLKEAMCHD